MQIAHHRPQVDAFEQFCVRGRHQMLDTRQRHDGRLLRDIDRIARAAQHISDEAHDVVMLGAVLRVVQQTLCKTLVLSGIGRCRACSGQAHAFQLATRFPHEQLGSAATEEHVGISVQQHGSVRSAVDQVHQQVLRGERLVSAQLQAAGEHHLLHAAFLDGVKPASHRLFPGRPRIKLQLVRNGASRTSQRRQGKARETLDATGVHRAKGVHLQESATLVLDENHFGQHEMQVGERLEQLIGRRGVVRVESVEREEHRLLGGRPRKLALGFVQSRQRDAAPQTHETSRTVLAIVHELIGEALLHKAERIDDIGIERLGIRIDSGHSTSP